MIGAPPIEISQATSRDFMQFAACKIPAYVLKSHGEPVAIAGFFQQNGDIFGYLDTRGELTRRESLTLVRRMRDVIQALDADNPLLVACNSGQFPQAPKLLKVLGFTKDANRTIGEMEVWKWQE